MANYVNTDKYSLYENKLYLHLDNDISELKLKKIGEGSEGEVYIFNNEILLKIYRQELLDEMPEIYNEERIQQISKMNGIKQTSLPIGPIYINGEFCGCMLHRFKLAPDFNNLWMVLGNQNRFDKFIQINEKIHELEEHGMYYKEILPQNILLPMLKKSELIDIDGDLLRFGETKKEEYKTEMYKSLFDLVLLKMFTCDVDGDKPIIDSFLEEYNVPKQIKKEIYKDHFNYELLDKFMKTVREDNIKQEEKQKRLNMIVKNSYMS